MSSRLAPPVHTVSWNQPVADGCHMSRHRASRARRMSHVPSLQGGLGGGQRPSDVTCRVTAGRAGRRAETVGCHMSRHCRAGWAAGRDRRMSHVASLQGGLGGGQRPSDVTCRVTAGRAGRRAETVRCHMSRHCKAGWAAGRDRRMSHVASLQGGQRPSDVTCPVTAGRAGRRAETVGCHMSRHCRAGWAAGRDRRMSHVASLQGGLGGGQRRSDVTCRVTAGRAGRRAETVGCHMSRHCRADWAAGRDRQMSHVASLQGGLGGGQRPSDVTCRVTARRAGRRAETVGCHMSRHCRADWAAGRDRQMSHVASLQGGLGGGQRPSDVTCRVTARRAGRRAETVGCHMSRHSKAGRDRQMSHVPSLQGGLGGGQRPSDVTCRVTAGRAGRRAETVGCHMSRHCRADWAAGRDRQMSHVASLQGGLGGGQRPSDVTCRVTARRAGRRAETVGCHMSRHCKAGRDRQMSHVPSLQGGLGGRQRPSDVTCRVTAGRAGRRAETVGCHMSRHCRAGWAAGRGRRMSHVASLQGGLGGGQRPSDVTCRVTAGRTGRRAETVRCHMSRHCRAGWAAGRDRQMSHVASLQGGLGGGQRPSDVTCRVTAGRTGRRAETVRCHMSRHCRAGWAAGRDRQMSHVASLQGGLGGGQRPSDVTCRVTARRAETVRCHMSRHCRAGWAAGRDRRMSHVASLQGGLGGGQRPSDVTCRVTAGRAGRRAETVGCHMSRHCRADWAAGRDRQMSHVASLQGGLGGGQRPSDVTCRVTARRAGRRAETVGCHMSRHCKAGRDRQMSHVPSLQGGLGGGQRPSDVTCRVTAGRAGPAPVHRSAAAFAVTSPRRLDPLPIEYNAILLKVTEV